VAFILTAIGLLLLVISLAGIALGIYMAVEPGNRESGRFFAIWWVPGLAAASGVLMRDVVTFGIGIVCFVVAGTAILFEYSRPRKTQLREKGYRRLDSEKTNKEKRTQDSRRAAS
jgi:hypothetical protein